MNKTTRRGCIVCDVTTDCMDEVPMSISQFSTNCPTFAQWRNFINSNCSFGGDNFSKYERQFDVQWLHSKESLNFFTNDLFKPLLKKTNSDVVVCLNTGRRFGHACLLTNGVPMLFANPAAPFYFPQPGFVEPILELFKFFSKGAVFTSRTKVMYFDIRTNSIDDISVFEPKAEAFVAADVVVLSLPMALIPQIINLNALLVNHLKLRRRIYKTYGVSVQRVVFDLDMPDTCAIVYFKSSVEDVLPKQNIMEDPMIIFRQHYIRHAHDGTLPEGWQYVLAQMPFDKILEEVRLRERKFGPLLTLASEHKESGSSFRRTCTFEDSLIEFFHCNLDFNSDNNDVFVLTQNAAMSERKTTPPHVGSIVNLFMNQVQAISATKRTMLENDKCCLTGLLLDAKQLLLEARKIAAHTKKK